MGGPLNEEEFHVIQGVLDLGKKKAFKAMTPLEKVNTCMIQQCQADQARAALTYQLQKLLLHPMAS